MMTEVMDQILPQLNRFGKENIAPHMTSDDEKGLFRREIFTRMGELGLCGMPIPTQYGGIGLPYSDFLRALETVANYSVPYAVTLSVSVMVQSIIEQFGDEKQKKKYLPMLTSGKEIGAFCLSESGSGSDAGSLKTTAKSDGENYLLNGSKMWITSAGEAKVYIVMARTSGPGSSGISAFIVDSETPGLKIGKRENKMGWRTSPTAEVVFENCAVPKHCLLKGPGEGFKIAMSALDKGRISMGAIAVGVSRAALNEAIQYCSVRQQFNKPLVQFQGLQWMLSDLAVEIEASDLLVKKAAHLYDQGITSPKFAAMAKLKATDTAMQVTTDCVQLLGGVGYTKEFPLERYMRDAKVLQIVEGTNQIQKIVIAKKLIEEFSAT